MEPFFLCLVAIIVFALVLVVLIAFDRTAQRKRRENDALNDNRPQQRGPMIIGGRRQIAVRRRTAAAPSTTARNEVRFRDSANEDSSDEADLAFDVDSLHADGKIGKKKAAKLQAKAEKRSQREAELQEREERKQREAEKVEIRRKQEEKEKEMELVREEAERQAREEKERKEHEEYLIMKQAFAVEDEGFDMNEMDENENMLQEFVNFVKRTKVVSMDELASQWKLKPQEIVERIKSLVADRTLTGVVDDRGKFIYITEEELRTVAKFINQRGRVSLAELVEYSNKLINLEPDIMDNATSIA